METIIQITFAVWFSVATITCFRLQRQNQQIRAELSRLTRLIKEVGRF